MIDLVAVGATAHSRDRDAAVRKFAAGIAMSVVLYGALVSLAPARALRPPAEDVLAGWPWLNRVAAAVSIPAVTQVEWDSDAALGVLASYAVVVAALVGAWAWLLQVVREGPPRITPLRVLACVGLVCVPLLCLPALSSNDVYLYAFYGRIQSTYGQNPLLAAPDQFWEDPHLVPVFWSWLPSSYGPSWLLLSRGLSALAGNDLTTNVLVYKGAMALVHVGTTVLVGVTLRARRPELTAWGMVFYGLNPLVLVEGVGNGHNDLLVALLAVGATIALSGGRSRTAAVLVTTAAMAKAFAAVLLVPIGVLAVLRGGGGVPQHLRRAALLALTVAATAVVIYAPLWDGGALVDNVLQNPASTEYNNSLWELLQNRGVDVRHVGVAVQPSERAPMLALLATAVVALLVQGWRGRPVAHVLAWTWCAYVASLAWVWPWYFLVAVPLAALAGPGLVAGVVGGLTLGGLLFWVGWTGPSHPLAPWLFEYRAVWLLGPAVAVGVAGAAVAVLAAARRRAPELDLLPDAPPAEG